MNYFKWLVPGIGIKRWLLSGIVGFILISIGMSIISDISIMYLLELKVKYYIYQYSQNYYFLAGILVLILGIFLVVVSFKEIIQVFFKAAFPEFIMSQMRPVFQQRFLKRGPKIVVLGGGTGLSVLLRGLKKYTNNITAIVSVADDGGSSGRLRDQLGILPPGDVRNCMVALADKEDHMEKLFNYRFEEGEDLQGHNLGNLLLAAMSDIYGNFEEAVSQMSKVLAIRGRVIPSTLENIILKARLQNGEIIEGESNISKGSSSIEEVFIEPSEVHPLDDALEAIKEADAVLLGPGSLYTSVIPNLLVSNITETIKESSALKIYVCNVMTQPGETEGYSAGKHLEVLIKHGGEDLVQYILVNNQPICNLSLLEKYLQDGASQVKVNKEEIEKMGVKIINKPLLEENSLIRHKSGALAAAIIEELLLKKGKSFSFFDRLLLQRNLKLRNEENEDILFHENKKRVSADNS